MNNITGKEVRWLRMSVLVNILLFLVVLFLVFIWTGKKRFEEIDVERINIIERFLIKKLLQNNYKCK